MEKDKNINENIKLFDNLAKFYDYPLLQYWLKQFHKPVLNYIDYSRKSKILDISCGTGELLNSIRKRDKNGKLELYGIDLTANMLKVARKKLSKEVILKRGDVHKLKFPENCFDYVISTEAFHHYYNQDKALQEMKRVAKIGGNVIIVDVNFFSRFVHKLFQRLETGCVKLNDMNEMKELFKKAGLKVINQKRNFLFSVVTYGQKL